MDTISDTEKIDYYDTLVILRTRIGGCFGDQDKIFAGHAYDEGRAKELRKLAAEKHIELRAVQDIALGYLYRKQVYPEHLIAQMKEVTTFFAKKLK